MRKVDRVMESIHDKMKDGSCHTHSHKIFDLPWLLQSWSNGPLKALWSYGPGKEREKG